MGAKGPKDLGAWARTRRFFDQLSPDIIHFVEPIIWMNAALLFTRHTRLWYAHGRTLPEQLRTIQQRLLFRFIAATNLGAVCISDGVRTRLIELGLREERLWTIYNAIDTKRFVDIPDRATARAQLHLPANAKVIGMVCRLTVRKGCFEALDVIKRLSPEWHLLYVGEGTIRPELEAKVRASGLGDRVHFAGALEDVRPAYAAMDAYLFLSRYEPFGLVLVEAMAAGVPIFGLQGQGEYSEPRLPLVTPETATLIPRANPMDQDSVEPAEIMDALAGRIESVTMDPEAPSRREYARQWVGRHFDAERQAREMLQVYNQVCCGSTNHAAAAVPS